jgi:hypothetical protein
VRCSGGGVEAPAALTQPPANGEPRAPTAPQVPAPGNASEPVREAATPERTVPEPSQPRAAQGVSGLVVDQRNNPLVDVRVFLLESVRNEPQALPVLLQQGLMLGPLAETRSAADGTFALGLSVANDKLYELRFLSPAYADVRIGDLRILPEQWHDTGAVTMAPGTTLRGRVTVEGTDTPVPQAIVTVEAGTVFDDAMQRGLPGRERGLGAQVDAAGYYELRNAPRTGVVQVSAVAPGFARVMRPNIEMASGAVELNFGLPPGLTLGGQVVDDAGAPIARARIEAWPMQFAANAEVAQSRVDGRFDVVGLRQGTYRLRVLARGYQNVDLVDQQPGRDDLRVVLRRRATIVLRVLAPDQHVVRSYQLGVRRWFRERGGQIGAVAELPDQRVRLDGLTDSFDVTGIPVGTFVVQVSADGFAKTLSGEVEVLPDTQRLALDVVLSTGGTLRGRVVDEAGQPLAGATVETQADGAAPDNVFWRIVAGPVPQKVTNLRVTTGPDGAFVLPLLAEADYQLQVDHPDACRVVVPGLAVTRSERLLDPIRLPAGAIVFGRATVGGKVAGQIKVVLSTAVAPDTPLATAAAALRLETVTDAAGAWQMPRRVPPGQYELRAAVVGDGNPDAQILSQSLQLKRSSTTLSVPAGQRQVEHHIDLPTDH